MEDLKRTLREQKAKLESTLSESVGPESQNGKMLEHSTEEKEDGRS
jgi:hypothetical protein